MSIPTTGPQGVRFRSRLEARWAAFFTLLGWNWEYEPELELSGWIPDFAIRMGDGLLIEVKPGLRNTDLDPHKPRIEKSGYKDSVLIVGSSWCMIADHNEPIMGLGGKGPKWLWVDAKMSDVKRKIEAVNPVDFEVAQRLWVKAGNALQWKRM